MAGTGKRGDQRKTLILNLHGNRYFKRDKSVAKNALPSISIRTIEERLEHFVREKKAKQSGDGYEIDLKTYKIVGSAKPHSKLIINARTASAGAKKAVEAAGGTITVQPNV